MEFNLFKIIHFLEESETPLTEHDFLEALKNINKSVSSNDLLPFEKWMAEFGSIWINKNLIRLKPLIQLIIF